VYTDVSTKDRIHRTLYQGGEQSPGTFRKAPHLHVACAEECPPRNDSGVAVVHLKLDDAEKDWLSKPAWIENVLRCAHVVSDAVQHGEVVLVTCYMGLNRSGLINGLALCQLGFTADGAIRRVQQRRYDALFNESFVEVIRALYR